MKAGFGQVNLNINAVMSYDIARVSVYNSLVQVELERDPRIS